MATQTINITSPVTSSFYIQLVLTDSNVDSVNNKTTLSYSITFVCSTYYHFNYNNQFRFDLNGTQLINTNNVAPINLGAGGTQLLLSGSMDITHEADGSKTVPWSLRFNQPYGSSGVYTAENSGTFACERVPRTSSITVSNGTLGTTQTITITKATSNFTSTLRYVCGNTGGTISNTSGTSVSWKPPLTLAQQDTRGTSVLCTVYCDTYSGNTLIGTTSKTITLAVPASVKPSVSSTTVAEGNTSVLPAATFAGTYVQGKSRAVVTVTASTANCQGATISSCIVTIGGTAYSASVTNSGTTATCTVTSPTLSATGTVSISATVTDTRGRTATGTATSITVYEYSAPKINSFSVCRSDSEGTASDEGTYGTFAASGSYSSVNNKNTYTSTIKYGLSTASDQELTTLTNTATTWTDIVSGLDTDQTYKFIYTVTDRFTSVSKTTIVSTAFYTVDFLAGGHGIAIGKAAEHEIAEINLPLYTNRALVTNGGIEIYNTTNAIPYIDFHYGRDVDPLNVDQEDYDGRISYVQDGYFSMNSDLQITYSQGNSYYLGKILWNMGQPIKGQQAPKSVTAETWNSIVEITLPYVGVYIFTYTSRIPWSATSRAACEMTALLECTSGNSSGYLNSLPQTTRSSVYAMDSHAYDCTGTFVQVIKEVGTKIAVKVYPVNFTELGETYLTATPMMIRG